MKLLSKQQLDRYDAEGYLHLHQVLPDEILRLTRKVLQRWADDLIQTWVDEQRIDDSLATLISSTD